MFESKRATYLEFAKQRCAVLGHMVVNGAGQHYIVARPRHEHRTSSDTVAAANTAAVVALMALREEAVQNAAAPPYTGKLLTPSGRHPRRGTPGSNLGQELQSPSHKFPDSSSRKWPLRV